MIETRNLSRRFGGFTAVNDLNLKIPGGEIFTLLGPNGAGKTTTIKMLCGLLHPSAGSIRIGGFDLASHSLQARQLLGYVPDFPFVYENLTAGEFLDFTGRIYRIPEGRLRKNKRRLWDLFGLDSCGGALARQLSHGYRQRLVFAACFLHEPKVLLIDEPMVGLDPASGRLLKDVLLDFAGKGGAVFLSTHALALAEEISSRIGIMSRGALRECGTPALIKGTRTLEAAFLEETTGDQAAPRSP